MSTSSWPDRLMTPGGAAGGPKKDFPKHRNHSGGPLAWHPWVILGETLIPTFSDG